MKIDFAAEVIFNGLDTSVLRGKKLAHCLYNGEHGHHFSTLNFELQRTLIDSHSAWPITKIMSVWSELNSR